MNPKKEQIKNRIANSIIPDDPCIPLNEFQAAKLINRSVHSLRRDRWAGGGIQYVKVSANGAVRYRRQHIDQYMQSRLRTSTSDSGDKKQEA